jgi:hypothetical protein
MPGELLLNSADLPFIRELKFYGAKSSRCRHRKAFQEWNLGEHR